MNKTIISWAVLLMVAGVVFHFFVAPRIWPDVQIVSEAELIDAGRDADGNQVYFMTEAREWTKTLTPVIVSVIGFMSAYFLKTGRKK